MSRPACYLGLDLAWKDGNASGAVALAGARWPLRLLGPPCLLGTHAEALGWIEAHARARSVVVGIDAPLLGLRPGGGRRGCDDAISRAFGRFHASTHSPPRAPDLGRWTAALRRRYGPEVFTGPARPGRPLVREVFPHALQVRLFDLDRRPGARILPYKRRRFSGLADWAHRGLGPFVAACRAALDGRVLAAGPAWQAFCAERPRPALGARRLKAIEDRWDAVLCALAVAMEQLAPGSMRLYRARPGAAAAILAPVLDGEGPA